jgi:integrase/recombinase XerD
MATNGKQNREGQARVLSPEEIKAVIERLPNDRYQLAVCLLYACAARASETLALRAEDLKGGFIHFRSATTKTREHRSVRISPELAAQLARYGVPDQGWVFQSSHGGHLKLSSLQKVLYKAFQALGLEGASTHSFRRSACTHLARKQVPLHVVASVSGHRSLSQLQQYLDVDPADHEQAAALLTLS